MITELIGQKKTTSKIKVLLGELGECFEYDTFGGLHIYDYITQGICLYFDEENTLVTVFLFSEGHDEHNEYSNNLPHGFAFNDNKKNVYGKLGKPETSGTNWDCYDFGSYLLHFKYSDLWAINMLTIMSPQLVKG